MRGVIPLAVLLTAISAVPHSSAAPLFEGTVDVGGLSGTGGTQFLGYAEVDGALVGQYLITGCRSAPGDAGAAFHFAYRRMCGPCGISARFEWVGDALDSQGPCGVMIRASEAPEAVAYVAGPPLDRGSLPRPCALAIHRVLLGGEVPAIECLIDWGAGRGWERIGPLQIAAALPEEVLVGVAVGSGADHSPAQAVVSDVRFQTQAGLVGPPPDIPRVPPAAAVVAAPTGRPGFAVRSIKAAYTKGWGREQMNRLLDFGGTGPICFAPGMPFPGMEAGERVVPFVNLYDSGDRGVFSAVTGHPDESFPGIDPPEVPAADPAGGDDDDHFATEVQALIHLSPGTHILGASHAGGLYVAVGGIQIGARDAPGLGGTPSDFLFEIAADGWYDLTARTFDTAGSAHFELHEVLPAARGRFTRVLLGDLPRDAAPVLAVRSSDATITAPEGRGQKRP